MKNIKIAEITQNGDLYISGILYESEDALFKFDEKGNLFTSNFIERISTNGRLIIINGGGVFINGELIEGYDFANETTDEIKRSHKIDMRGDI